MAWLPMGALNWPLYGASPVFESSERPVLLKTDSITAPSVRFFGCLLQYSIIH
jgi:hypothetical protein